MRLYADILHRAARFWSWATADHAAYLVAVLVAVWGDPTLLVDALMWAWDLLFENYAAVLLLYFLRGYIWSWIPPWVKRPVLWIRDRYATPDDPQANPEDSERIAALEAEVEDLKARLDRHDNRGRVNRDG